MGLVMLYTLMHSWKLLTSKLTSVCLDAEPILLCCPGTGLSGAITGSRLASDNGTQLVLIAIKIIKQWNSGVHALVCIYSSKSILIAGVKKTQNLWKH